MLDKLFSREIKRRTGAHVINIYSEDVANAKGRKRRSQAIGASAIKASNTPKAKITPQQAKHSFFYRLNVRFPWLKLALVCLIGVVALLDLFDLTISRVNDPNSKVRVAPFSQHIRATNRVFEGKKLVALTFDDGPSDLTTPQLLDILQEKDVLATFFTLGNMARNNPDIIKRAKKEGHEIASHTMYHQNLIRISAQSAADDIHEAASIIKDIIGHDPTLTRPPYGNYNDVVSEAADTPLILWSVDTEDWRSKDPDAILDVTMSEVHDGAIILMHDIYPTTVEAVPRLIDALREEGYEFATISELTKFRDIKLDAGTAYYNLRP